MKGQISITVDENILSELDNTLKKGLFRNKSHIFEYAVRKLLEGKNE